MKLVVRFLALLVALTWNRCCGLVDSHCRRYRACLASARSDYELCVGGVAAGIVADYETPEHADVLLKHSGAVAECENRNFVKIMEFKAIRRLEEDDIIKCTENTDSKPLSDMKKLACIGTPVTWSLQDLARGALQKPSQCRELFMYQLERCAFLASCCPPHSICMSNITTHSLAYQQRIQRGHTMHEAAKKCLELLNNKYESSSPLPENEITSTDTIPGFKQPLSLQQKRIEDAVSEARASITTTTNRPGAVHRDSIATTPQTTVATLPTFPTLPTLPNLLHVLFPGLTSTTPQPTTTTISTTITPVQSTATNKTKKPDTESDVAKKTDIDTDFAKDGEGPEAEKKRMRLTVDENKKLCQEALQCESRLRGYKLECGKKHIEELKNPLSRAAYTDLVILKELLRNIEDSEATPAVRKSCILPIMGNFTDPLTNLLNEMEVKHSACTEKSTFYKKSIDPEEKEKCLAISTDIIFEEMSFENGKLRNSAEKSGESFETCITKIEFATKKCNEAKDCCPGYKVCTKLMLESDTATKYNEMQKKVKDIQKKCEMETISNLTSVHPGFVPYFQ